MRKHICVIDAVKAALLLHRWRYKIHICREAARKIKLKFHTDICSQICWKSQTVDRMKYFERILKFLLIFYFLFQFFRCLTTALLKSMTFPCYVPRNKRISRQTFGDLCQTLDLLHIFFQFEEIYRLRNRNCRE